MINKNIGKFTIMVIGWEEVKKILLSKEQFIEIKDFFILNDDLYVYYEYSDSLTEYIHNIIDKLFRNLNDYFGFPLRFHISTNDKSIFEEWRVKGYIADEFINRNFNYHVLENPELIYKDNEVEYVLGIMKVYR